MNASAKIGCEPQSTQYPREHIPAPDEAVSDTPASIDWTESSSAESSSADCGEERDSRRALLRRIASILGVMGIIALMGWIAAATYHYVCNVWAYTEIQSLGAALVLSFAFGNIVVWLVHVQGKASRLVAPIRELSLLSLQFAAAALIGGALGDVLVSLYSRYITPDTEPQSWMILSMALLLAIFRASGLGKTFVPGLEPEPAPSLTPIESLGEVISLMRRRAQRLGISANWLLALIVVALTVGAFVFVFAGRQASREANVRMDVLRLQIDGKGEAIRSIERSIKFEEEMLVRREPDFANRAQAVQSSNLERMTKKHEDLEKLRKEKDELLKQAEETAKEIDAMPDRGNATTIYFVSSLSTKTGVVLLLVFLVRILTAQYRYNIRLASFLSARADAVQLKPPADPALGNLVALMSPEMIDYADRIKSESQLIAFFAKALSIFRNIDPPTQGPADRSNNAAA